MSSTIHTKIDMSILLLLVIGLIVMAIAFRHVWMAAAAHVFHPHIVGWLIGGAVVVFFLMRFLAYPVSTIQNSHSEIVMNSSASGSAIMVSDPSPVVFWKWIVLAVLTIAIIAFAAQGHLQLRVIVKPLFILVLLGLCGVFLVGLYSYRETRTATISQQNERMLIAQAEMKASQSRIPIESPPIAAGAETPKAPIAEKPVSENVAGNTDEAKPSSDSLPVWIKNTEAAQDGDFYAVVQSGKDLDPMMRDVRLDVRMIAVANDVIDNKMFRGLHMADVVNIEPAYLRQYCVAKQYPTIYPVPPGEEIYVQLHFDGKFRDEIKRRYHEIVSSDRLTQLGGTALAALAVLSGAYVYLRKTTPKQGSGFGVQGSAQANV